MNVPFLSLKELHEPLVQDLSGIARKVIGSGSYLLGEETSRFEKSFSKYCNRKHCATVGSGLDALYFSLAALGIKKGDEVIVPSHTFIATWLAVSRTGALPVPVEPSGDSFNIDPDAIEDAITPKTKAIVPVHLYGEPCDMDPILEIASRYDLSVVEDAAQGHGSTYKGQRIGSFGDASAFSFYPGKNLGALGDAGAIASDNPELIEKVNALRNYGSTSKYLHETSGYNSRIDELQAAFLSKKLSLLDEWNAKRRKVAEFYSSRIKNPCVDLPGSAFSSSPSWHLYVIKVRERESLVDFLEKKNIQTLIHYPTPPHKQGAYSMLPWKGKPMEFTERLSMQVLSLPIGPALEMSEASYVAETVNQWRP